NGVITSFYLDGDKILAQDMYSANTGVTLNVVYTYGSDGLCGFEYDNRKFLYKKNIFGDILSIYNEQGIEIVKYIYDAWGNHRAYYLSNGTFVECDNILTSTTEENKLLAYLNPFRYRGYYFDIDSGLYYLQTRYYDPETGRFINADDISYLDPETLNGLNLFAYCGNNPVMFTDPNGTTKWWEWLLAGFLIVGCVVVAMFTGGSSLAGAALIGAAIGGTISVISQAITTGELDWGQFALDVGVGFISGAVGYGLGNLGSLAGSSFGYSLSQASIQGIKIGKVFSFLGGSKFLVSAFNILGKLAGEFIGGYVASEFLFPIYTKKENTDQIFQDLSTEMIFSKLLEKALKWFRGL
ncbi:MAG: hypothetical protein E7362_03205, partial [Clostridiales bacterium]|nr:hypothetical protein [Clostridiales bacterium]